MSEPRYKYTYFESPMIPLEVYQHNLNESVGEAVSINYIREQFAAIPAEQIPLDKINYSDFATEAAKDPLTGKPYQGLILHGCFADLSNEELNNNNRYYDVSQYLAILRIFRKMCMEDAVYGELEHPEKYVPNSNVLSHRVLDVYYNPSDKKVYGYILLLNTAKGREALEKIRSGGTLQISARAGGDEIERPDGTKYGVLKLLTTYDIVYRAGFDACKLKPYINNLDGNAVHLFENGGYMYMLPSDKMENIAAMYENYEPLHEGSCFMSDLPKLYESAQEQSEQEIIEQNSSSSEQKAEDDLQDAVEDLNESAAMNTFKAQNRLRLFVRQ